MLLVSAIVSACEKLGIDWFWISDFFIFYKQIVLNGLKDEDV